MSSPGKQQASSIKSSSRPPAVPSPVDIEKDAETTATVIADSVKEIKSTIPNVTKESLIQEKIPRRTNLKSESVIENLPTVHVVSHIKKLTEAQKGQQKLDEQRRVNVAVPRHRVPRPAPLLNVRPIVLATHLVPSLPIGLFELLAEAVEAATELPVSLLYESRSERPVAKDITDLVVLPAYAEWEDGDLLPVTFVFAHRLNNSGSGNVYVDVIVTADRAPHVKDIMDLRGHRCALPDRKQRRGAAALLLGDLRAKGESPAFFGTTLDSGSQVAALQMVAGRQAEVGVVEAPILACHRHKMPGVDSLLKLGSLGPLPPYAIYVKKSVSAELREKISSYLLNLKNNEDWLERFSQYGVVGFTTNSPDAYIIDDDQEVVTSVRYY